MYYYKARIYSPTLGRFLQTDPIGYKDWINLYEYVGDDPVDNDDFTGDESASVTCSGAACGQGTFSLPSLDDVADTLDALGDVANSFPDGQVVGEPFKELSAVLVVGSRDLKALKAVESAGQKGAKAEREANLAKGVRASKLGPSGKPMIHNVQHYTAKAAKEAAQREAPQGGKVRFDAHPRDGNRPHFQAEDAKGRNVQPVVHHCVPDSSC